MTYTPHSRRVLQGVYKCQGEAEKWVSRSDLGGMSMGFSMKGSEFDMNDQGRRSLKSVDLREISIVQAFPAYETSVEARSRGRATPQRDELLTWLKEVEK